MYRARQSPAHTQIDDTARALLGTTRTPHSKTRCRAATPAEAATAEPLTMRSDTGAGRRGRPENLHCMRTLSKRLNKEGEARQRFEGQKGSKKRPHPVGTICAYTRLKRVGATGSHSGCGGELTPLCLGPASSGPIRARRGGCYGRTAAPGSPTPTDGRSAWHAVNRYSTERANPARRGRSGHGCPARQHGQKWMRVQLRHMISWPGCE